MSNTLSVTYAGNSIHTADSSETFKLKTSGKFMSDDVTISADFLDTSDANATSGDMLSGKTAYVNGSKVTGNIATKTGTDLSASGKTVTVPAGYYASQVTKDVATTTHPNPTATVNTTTGLVTASHTQTAGYVSAGTTTGTLQLTVYAGSVTTA